MKRRGLSTIVGATFFVIVMGSTIGYVTYSMDLVDNLAYQVDASQDRNLNRQSEDFIIADVEVVNNEFNLTVTNTGTIPINVTKMWAKNMTDSSWNQTSYTINQVIAPGASSNVGTGTGLVAMDSESYSLKLLTSRGNALETQVVSASNQPLEMTLFTTPSSPLSDQVITLLYYVKNNLTNGAIIKSLTPLMSTSTTGGATTTLKTGPSPNVYVGLPPGQTAFFEWEYDMTGTDGDQITYNATLTNAVQGNNVTDTVTVDIAPVAVTSINEVLGGLVGVVSMNFTSFQACDVPNENCKANTSFWKRAWDLNTSTFYTWRIDLTNNGLHDLIIDENTALIFMVGVSGGGAATPLPYFIRAASLPSDEDPGEYDPPSCDPSGCPQILDVDETETIYFASKGISGIDREETYGSPGVIAVFMLLVAHEDRNSSGDVDSGDEPYGQNLPFQAFTISTPP